MQNTNSIRIEKITIEITKQARKVHLAHKAHQVLKAHLVQLEVHKVHQEMMEHQGQQVHEVQQELMEWMGHQVSQDWMELMEPMEHEVQQVHQGASDVRVVVDDQDLGHWRGALPETVLGPAAGLKRRPAP